MASPSRSKETNGCGMIPLTTVMVSSMGVMKAKLAVVNVYCVPGLFGSRGGYMKYPSVRKRRPIAKWEDQWFAGRHQKDIHPLQPHFSTADYSYLRLLIQRRMRGARNRQAFESDRIHALPAALRAINGSTLHRHIKARSR